MTYFIRKIHVAIAFLLLTSVGYAYGDYGNNSNWSACGVNECCSPCQPVCCQPDCCGKFFVGAELLYWRAFESGLDECVPGRSSDTITSDGKVISTFDGRSREPDFRWNPGFRIGAGYEFGCNCWDVAAIWTHFNSNTHSSKKARNERRWKIDFDVLDIVTAYNYDLSTCIELRPFFGLRGARIDQKLHTGGFPCSSTSVDRITSKNHSKDKFWGVGPLLGIDADWGIGCGFSLYANGSLSWLYGRFNSKQIEFDNSVDSLDSCRIRRHPYAVITSGDAGLGVRWQRCICNTRVILQFGVEHHQYFDFNHLGGCCGDLSFDGINLGAGLEF